VAGINAGKESRPLTLNLPFINYTDGVLITENDSPRSFSQKNITLDSSKNVSMSLNPNGGFVMRFGPSANKLPENK
jgi:hypothetical protein